MTTTEPELDRNALTTMVARFVDHLSAEGLTACAVRLETKLVWPRSPDALFALETAMTAAWSRENATCPKHELIWVTERAAGDWVKIRAFDRLGRLLLDRQYTANFDLAGDPSALAHPHALQIADAAAARVCSHPSPARVVFLVEVQGATDALARVLCPFAVLQVELSFVELTRTDRGANIRLEAERLDDQRAQLLAHRLKQAPGVLSVGLGWRSPTAAQSVWRDGSASAGDASS